jgi:hypothetical protein
MFDSNSAFLPSNLSSSALPALSCAVSGSPAHPQGTAPSVEYCASDDEKWKIGECCLPGGPILLRNAVAHNGQLIEVRPVSPDAFGLCQMRSVFISRNVASLGANCLSECPFLQIVAFECDSHLREIGAWALDTCPLLQSIAIPSSVGFLPQECFSCCRSLRSVTFERPSKLTTIEQAAFWYCQSLTRLFIPVSVTAIAESAFTGSGLESIEIDDGSVSFRVVNEFLVDFEVRSLVWVIGSVESIEIPSSIEELRPYCCRSQKRLTHVGFESNSHLLSIGEFAFAVCDSLESVFVPSSVEVLREGCFSCCWGLGTVTFAAESKLRLIERDAFKWSPQLELVSVPASAEVAH